MKWILTALLLSFSVATFAGTPTCFPDRNYCKYYGKVKQLYVNNGNLILLYFENPLDIATAESTGLNARFAEAAAVKLRDSNRDFAQMLYSTALSAYASGSNITIQMRDVESGYLEIDRIWIME